MDVVTLVLGGGIAGHSIAFHLTDQRCLVLDRNSYNFGHSASFSFEGCVFDEGPHVSFTNHTYVRELFSRSVKGMQSCIPVMVGNWYCGNWITHPAQSNLYQVPEPLRSECLRDMIKTCTSNGIKPEPRDYQEWCEHAFGTVFANEFVAKYTRKYWTVEPSFLTTDWVGTRVFKPDLQTVLRGAEGPQDRTGHYIKEVRYPTHGGFQSFLTLLASNSEILGSTEIVSIDLMRKIVSLANGTEIGWSRLVNSIPLPDFIEMCVQSTPEVLEAARDLDCSHLLLVNVVAPRQSIRPENWIYIYDEDMHSTRIHFTEKLSSNNVVSERGGIQVEVYSSRYRPQMGTDELIAECVVNELIQMGIVDGDIRESLCVSTRRVKWANVIFTHNTRKNLNVIWSFLEKWGLQRELNDLDPITDWSAQNSSNNPCGEIVMTGRYGFWKYYWTDDCVLRGKQIADRILLSAKSS